MKCFQLALKISWIRRLINNSAFWPKILCEEIKSIVLDEVKISNIIQLGPNYFSFVGKKTKQDEDELCQAQHSLS